MKVEYTSHIVHVLRIFSGSFWQWIIRLFPLFRVFPVLVRVYPLPINTVLTSEHSVTLFIAKTHPLRPRTCHHFTPPTILLATSSPPKAFVSSLAASSQQDMGTRTRITSTHGGEGVRVFPRALSSMLPRWHYIWLYGRTLQFFHCMTVDQDQ